MELEFHKLLLLLLFFKVSFHYNSIVQKSSITLKLVFPKIKFQNKGISLNSFRYGAFCWKVCEKEVKPQFGHKTYDLIIMI